MRSFALLALAQLAFAAPTEVAQRSEPAPILQPRGVQTLPGKYIVKLKSTAVVDDTIAGLPAKPKYTYKSKAFAGFASELSSETVAKLQNNPEVEYIEQDAIITINTYVTQTNAPWGIARISHHAPGSTNYVYDDSAGAGTCSYIIDTGIYIGHSNFGGRAFWLTNTIDTSNTDGNGHGTHVAGTVGSNTYGVAKKTKLYAVKVLNSAGSGTSSSVIAGINYVANDAQTRDCPAGTVANMSLGGGKSTAINSAAAALIRAGVFLAVAAGNDNANANAYSPASEPTVCTVGATTINDAKASYSNYGPIVDIWAPGTNILSTWIGSTTATNTISGTSMATPHITGLGAYLLTLFGPRAPQALCSYIQSIATSGVITGLPSGSLNLLAFNGNPSG